MLLCLLLLACMQLTAQSGKKILTSANLLEYDEYLLPGAQRLLGNVVFQHEDVIGYCDSAYYYEADNYLIAFGKPVRIHIGDSVQLYGKKVYYDGNERVASIARQVEMVHENARLYSDSLIYDMKTEEGYYVTGGLMVNIEDTLYSLIGRYYTKTDKAFLYEQVLLQNPSYTMDCDSLMYDAGNETVYFISRTRLISDDNTLFTNSGWYDTKNDLATLVDSVEGFNQTQQMMTDSLYYDKNRNFGIAWNNVVLFDSIKGYILKGNYVEYHEKGGWSLATDSNLLILIDQGDSLYLHSDTLRMLMDTTQEPQHIFAYNHVKFFKKDLQGACDSLAYLVVDSLLYMYFNPVLWSDSNQLTADTISMFIIDSTHIRLNLQKSAFIVSSVFEGAEFNQVKGVTVVGYIVDKELRTVDVINNAECVYYILDEDSALVGVNTSATSEMRVVFADNEIDGIIYYNSPDGKIYPYKDITKEERILRDFRWLDEYRPYAVKDIFVNPIPRAKVKDSSEEEASDTNP